MCDDGWRKQVAVSGGCFCKKEGMIIRGIESIREKE